MKTTLLKGPRGLAIFNDPPSRAKQRARALAELHRADVEETDDGYVVDASAFYTPSSDQPMIHDEEAVIASCPSGDQWIEEHEGALWLVRREGEAFVGIHVTVQEAENLQTVWFYSPIYKEDV